jgi:hypothetical protein
LKVLPLRPIIAAPGEDLGSFIGEMDLDPITVELDLVNPSFAARYLFDGCRERGFDEAGKRANRGLFLSAGTPRLHQAHGQGS